MENNLCVSVIKTLLAVRTVSSCALVLNVEMPNMQRVNRNLDVPVNRLTVLKVHQWQMIRTVKKEENVKAENVFRFVKHKECKVACVILVSTIFRFYCHSLRICNNFDYSLKRNSFSYYY